ncbi:MAG: hypothetical protein ONB05_06000 [candidate division KSB1 bacterium]|nr:hypothetical protein [candidate division KSB1 bacterium]
MPINFKKSFFISLGLHLILLLVFLFTKLAWEIKELEFVEISFLSTASSMPRPQLTEVFPLTEEIAGSESELVKLPSRRMLEEIEPELSVRDAGKLTPEERPLQLQKEPTREVQLPQVGVGEKEVAAPTELSLDEKDLPQSTPEVAAGV